MSNDLNTTRTFEDWSVAFQTNREGIIHSWDIIFRPLPGRAVPEMRVRVYNTLIHFPEANLPYVHDFEEEFQNSITPYRRLEDELYAITLPVTSNQELRDFIRLSRLLDDTLDYLADNNMDEVRRHCALAAEIFPYSYFLGSEQGAEHIGLRLATCIHFLQEYEVMQNIQAAELLVLEYRATYMITQPVIPLKWATNSEFMKELRAACDESRAETWIEALNARTIEKIRRMGREAPDVLEIWGVNLEAELSCGQSPDMDV